MADYQRPSNKLLIRGMNITRPSDQLSLEWAQLLKNLRSYRLGEIRQRPGLSLIADIDPGASDAVLAGRRITTTTGLFRRHMVTAAGNYYTDDAGHTNYAVSGTGYAAEPVTWVIARPDRATAPFGFVSNSGKMAKVSYLGTPTNWGMAAPVSPPTAELVPVAYRVVDNCEATAGFVGTGGALTAPARISAVAIDYILYDSGTTGWACVVPASMDENWQEGVFVTTSAAAETVVIESIYQQIAATTVGSIVYDSGATGLCTIQLATPTLGLQRNSILRLNATENVRVLSVTRGLDGIPSIRCSTTGTIAAGNAVAGFRSFRAYFANNHAAAETLSTNYVQLAVAGAGLSDVAKAGALDLSSTNVNATRPIQPTDFVHVSLRVSDFTLITELQLQFDVDAATNDFTQNYFFKSFRPPDLLAAIKQTSSSLTAQQQEIQREQIDEYRRQSLIAERDQIMAEAYSSPYNYYGDYGYYEGEQQRQDRIWQINTELSGFDLNSGIGAVSAPSAGGDNQWTEFKIPISNFQRIGSDQSRSWRDVMAFRVTANTTGAVDIGIDALWIGGSYGLNFNEALDTEAVSDVSVGGGYNWVYRARNTVTGSRSNPSPPLRSMLLPERESVAVTVPSGYPDSQANVFDIFRIGGTLAEYHYVGTLKSNASPLTFYDSLPDDVAVTYPILEYDRFQPWAIPTAPVAGVCNAVGTRITRVSGGSFNTAWARGTPIIIDGKAYTLYTNPESTETLQLNETVGTLTSVQWEVPEGLATGQILPVAFGPYGTGVSGEFIFGCGDTVNPGYLYWTNGNDPESQSDVNILELCPPNEKLQNGCVLDGIVYVWSERRSWRVLPSFQGGGSGGGSLFYGQETAMGKGLAAKWALAVGDQLYFLSWDGIYASRGDAVVSLTDESIAPLFRRDGSAVQGGPYNGLYPVDFSAASEPRHTLTYSRDGLYFTYKATDGNMVTLFYSFLTQGWWWDSSSDPISVVIREDGPGADTVLTGSTSGKVYQYDSSALLDGAVGISCIFNSREEDFGDSRAQKQLGDVMVDIDPASQTVLATAGFDNATTSLALTPNMTDAVRNRLLRSYANTLARSVSMSLSWLSVSGGGAGVPKIYEWQPAGLIKPEFVASRPTDWMQPAGGHPVWLQGMRLTADTYNSVKNIVVEADDGTTVATIAATHNGEVIKPYVWAPVVVRAVRVKGQDATGNWRIINVEWVFKLDSETVTRWHTQLTSLGFQGYWYVRDLIVAHESSADLTLSIVVDGVSYGYTIPHGSGSRIRSYLPIQPIKGKYMQFVFTSAASFRLYLRDCELRAKAWGLGGPYQVMRPFGDLSFDEGDGARI